MKIKKFNELKEFDIVCTSNGYDIVLQKEKEYVMLAPYIMKKDLIDLEEVKMLAPTRKELYFNVIDNLVEKVSENHYIVNGNDIKIL